MTDNRKKILQIIGNAKLGGVASCILNYMQGCDLKNYRFDFAVYAPSDFDGKVKEIDGNSVIYYIPPLDKNPLGAARAIKKICLGESYAAVHSHMTILSAVALKGAADAKVPVRICHAHSTFNKNSDRYLIKKFMRPFAARYATHLAACSTTAAESTFKDRAGSAFILPNAIDAQRFGCTEDGHAEARRACNITRTAALFTGRFAEQKNLKFLLEAFALAERDDMELILLGGGPQQEELMELCGRLGIADKVRFVPPCDPAVWYKAADVFCLPSLYEGLSISAVEAQAAGLKCLLSDAVAKETDITGNCEFLKPDTAVWADRLNGTFGRDCGAAGKVAAAGYDVNREAHRLTDYYDGITGER